MRRLLLVVLVLVGLYALPGSSPLEPMWNRVQWAAFRYVVTATAACYTQPRCEGAAVALLREVRTLRSEEEQAIIDRYLELEGVDLRLR